MKTLWDKALEILNGDISDISFNNWVKDINPIEISNDTIIAITSNKHILGETNKNFISLIELALKIASGKDFKLILKNTYEMKNKTFSNYDSLCSINVENELFYLKKELKTIEEKINILQNKVNEKS